jgi:hypothetical protein
MFARYRAKLLQMLIQRYELPGGASASPPP